MRKKLKKHLSKIWCYRYSNANRTSQNYLAKMTAYMYIFKALLFNYKTTDKYVTAIIFVKINVDGGGRYTWVFHLFGRKEAL